MMGIYYSASDSVGRAAKLFGKTYEAGETQTHDHAFHKCVLKYLF